MIEPLRFHLATLALKTPWIYYGMCRIGVKGRDLTVTRDTELVLEGFPRSGNTFSAYAFSQAQGREVRVAHHHHAQAQVIRAVRWGIPSCVLIRNPEEAVRSLVVRNPRVSVTYGLGKYIHFYRDVEPYRDGFVLGPFEEVTSSLDRTVERINRRFGTSFVPFLHTPENEQRVFEQIRSVNEQYNAGAETGVAMPSETKNRMKARVSLEDHQGLLGEARAIYQRFMDRFEAASR